MQGEVALSFDSSGARWVAGFVIQATHQETLRI